MTEIKKDYIYLSLGIIMILIGIYLLFSNQPKFLTCVDGDTFKWGDTWYRLSFMDTAEKGEPTYVASSKYTCDYLRHNDFTLKTHGKDIYGRTLVEVNPQHEYTLNELLVRECLAEPFYGKTNQTILDLFKECKNGITL